MKQLITSAIILAATCIYTSCSSLKEVQAEFTEAKLIKVDTIFRFPASEIQLTFRCQNKVQLVSFVPMQRGYYELGATYNVLLTR